MGGRTANAAAPERAQERVRAAGLDPWAADNLLGYLREQRESTGVVPDDRTVLVERFRDELGELTRDLSPARRDAGPGTGLGTPDRAEPPARRVTGGTGPSTSLAIMGGCERAGAWTLPADHTAVALMGGIEIDLREATLQSHQTTIRAFAVMGGIDILVPDDIHLEVEGLGIMGGFAEESGEWAPDPRPVRQAPPGAPRVRVTGLALMGGVGVRRVPAPAPRA